MKIFCAICSDPNAPGGQPATQQSGPVHDLLLRFNGVLTSLYFWVITCLAWFEFYLRGLIILSTER